MGEENGKNIYWGDVPEHKAFAQKEFQRFLDDVNTSPQRLRDLCFHSDGRLRHLIRVDQLDLPLLETLCETTTAARRVARLEDKFLKGLLTSKSVLNLFAQASTRTFLSFSAAEAHLGMRREEVRDVKTSSQVKGESEADGLRTVSSYFNAIVCRHPSDIYDLFAVWALSLSDRPVSFINAGSGTTEHPTQGILDYYTLRRSFESGLDGKAIAYVGDCLRGRTVHSLAKIMALHQGSTAYFVAPEHLQIDAETEGYVRAKGTRVEKVTTGFRDLAPLVDAVYMTRIQDEHDPDKTKKGYDPKLIFTPEILESMKPDAIVMHPLPKREEIAPEMDYTHDKRIMYWRQERNGMWARVAILAHIFGVDDKIRKQYERIKEAA